MCTDFMLPKSTGKLISGRTMDFFLEPTWQLAAIPAGTTFTAVKPLKSSRSPLSWTAKYPLIGIGVKSKAQASNLRLTDAMNTKGFSGAMLWLPGSEYPGVKDAPGTAQLLSAFDIVVWAVSSFASVAALKKGLALVSSDKAGKTASLWIWDPAQSGSRTDGTFQNAAPLHFQFHDNTGASLVVEFRNGKMEITNNDT